MKADLIIRNAKQLLTLRGSNAVRKGYEMENLGIIKNGSVAVLDDKIIAVETSEQIAAGFKAEKVIDATDKVVMPGFVVIFP